MVTAQQGLISLPCVRLKEQNLVKETKPKDILESSSDSDEKIPISRPSSLPKRKLDLEGETVEKKKKGRPRKDTRLLPVALSVQVRLLHPLSLQGSPARPSPALVIWHLGVQGFSS